MRPSSRVPSAVHAILAAVALSGILLVALPTAQAQFPGEYVYRYQLEVVGDTRIDVGVNQQVLVTLRFTDQSRDGYVTYLPPGSPPVPNASPLQHQVSWEITPAVEDDGWILFPPSSFLSIAGQVTEVTFPLQVTAQARNDFYPFNVTAVVDAYGNQTRTSVTLLGYSLGPQSFGAQVGRSYELGPREIANVEVNLINLGIDARSFDMEVAENPCGMLAATTNNNLVPGKGSSVYSVSIQTPGKKLWYFSELCPLAILVKPTDNPNLQQVVYVSVLVNGGYVNPVWVFQAIAVLLILLLLILLVARRKARIEEEILGKPQKPWTIPVEALYLRALKQKDPRAWYVVRHYLMEDEYRSALGWYSAYKKATKTSRKKESLVLRQEKKYNAWKADWQKEIDRPIKKADRFEAALQKKLDRLARKAHRKQMGKYTKLTAKMKAAHAAQVERAGKQHAKAAAKAAKKGLPAPKRPVVPEPDYPDEPELVPIPLAEHKWSKKAARFRARMVRKQGDLEVKFEKADARMLRKVRRKVHKLAKKLDDPEFVAEHPLLQAN